MEFFWDSTKIKYDGTILSVDSVISGVFPDASLLTQMAALRHYNEFYYKPRFSSDSSCATGKE